MRKFMLALTLAVAMVLSLAVAAGADGSIGCCAR